MWKEIVNFVKNSTQSLVNMYDTEMRRVEINKVYHTVEDFKRCPVSVPRLVVIGCTGAGKSTLLNIVTGNRYSQSTDFRWMWSSTPLFKATHGCNAVTQSASYAYTHWFSNYHKPVIVVDTPGHDDTEGRDIQDRRSRDVLREQAADIHNKLKGMESLNTILVVHNQISSNRLNPATYAVLQMINEKFGDSIWKNVVIAYSQCNTNTEASWNTDVELKIQELRKEIRSHFSNCSVDVPVLLLGGGVNEDDYTTDVERETGFTKLWEIIQRSESIDTRNIRPFEGSHWKKYEEMVRKRDDAVAKSEAAIVYVSVMIKLAIVVTFLSWRTLALPEWLSILFLNIPYTSIDDILSIVLFVAFIGPVKCKHSILVFVEQWITPYVNTATSTVSKYKRVVGVTW